MTMTEAAPTAAPAGAAEGPTSDHDATQANKGKGRKAKAPKGRSNLLPALVLAAGVAAGGYFMGGGNSTSAADPTVVTAPPEAGEMVQLDPMTLNLAEGRFLRVGVAFRMTEDFESEEGDDGAFRFSPQDQGRLRDQLIAMFSGRDGSQLVTSDQLDATKDELLERANALFNGQAIEVYLTDFVMQ